MYTKSFAGVRMLLSAILAIPFFFLTALAEPAFATDPQEPGAVALYHQIWETARSEYHDVSGLANWSQWEHKYDAQIKSDADAITYANQMLATLNDQYTFAFNQDNTRQYR